MLWTVGDEAVAAAMQQHHVDKLVKKLRKDVCHVEEVAP